MRYALLGGIGLLALFVYWNIWKKIALYLLLKSKAKKYDLDLQFGNLKILTLPKMNEKLIYQAASQYGITEDPSTAVNDARIIQYSKDTGFNFSTDEIPWCSVFVNWVAKKVGAQMSKSAMARSWLKIGENVDKSPKTGDVVIFQRAGSPTSGHVGFYIGPHEDGKRIYVLGGNQSNQVNIVPFSKSDILGYRRLKAA